ncbi:hypothetical protein ER308_12015 [Egibacter rhizosphaerae]|uniref:Uncharacterized protein n=1 Tax=Egibacter rhizosphaerae TaxID=1670831 RepID=A0A411YG63_9ACTN|nr:hypothetical protein ER308_12015 [Egibacter rhizosphaerae]
MPVRSGRRVALISVAPLRTPSRADHHGGASRLWRSSMSAPTRGTNQRNGGRSKTLSRPVLDVELGIPKGKFGCYSPSLLEPRRRVDRVFAVSSQGVPATPASMMRWTTSVRHTRPKSEPSEVRPEYTPSNRPVDCPVPTDRLPPSVWTTPLPLACKMTGEPDWPLLVRASTRNIGSSSKSISGSDAVEPRTQTAKLLPAVRPKGKPIMNTGSATSHFIGSVSSTGYDSTSIPCVWLMGNAATSARGPNSGSSNHRGYCMSGSKYRGSSIAFQSMGLSFTM